jgi:hypothetical protein
LIYNLDLNQFTYLGNIDPTYFIDG